MLSVRNVTEILIVILTFWINGIIGMVAILWDLFYFGNRIIFIYYIISPQIQIYASIPIF